MKKSLITATAIAIIGAAGYAVINSNNQQREFSDLELANIEALTEGEGGSSNSWTCWSQSDKSSGGYWRCGNPCIWIDGEKGTKGESKCYNQ